MFIIGIIISSVVSLIVNAGLGMNYASYSIFFIAGSNIYKLYLYYMKYSKILTMSFFGLFSNGQITNNIYTKNIYCFDVSTLIWGLFIIILENKTGRYFLHSASLHNHYIMFAWLIFYAFDVLLLFVVILIMMCSKLSLAEETFANMKSQNAVRSYNRECIICTDRFVDADIVEKLKCSHIFHKHCVDEWIIYKKCCPLCKSTGLSGNSIRDIIG